MSVRAAKRPGTANGPISIVRAAPWQEAARGESATAGSPASYTEYAVRPA
jgi:hypothetical protein